VQGTSKAHMIQLVNAATKGKSPWTRVNNNPPNTIYRVEDLGKYHFHSLRNGKRLGGDEIGKIISSHILSMYRERPWE